MSNIPEAEIEATYKKKTFGDYAKDVGKSALEIAMLPFGALSKPLGPKQMFYKNIAAQRTPSDLLLYRSYKRKKGQSFGVYRMANRRKAVMFEIEPGPYSGDMVEKVIASVLRNVDMDNIAIQFTTYASDNISDYAQRYYNVHGNTEHLNLDGKKNIEKISKKKIEYYKSLTKKSMLKFNTFMTRNITNIVSISMHKTVKRKEIEYLYAAIYSALEDLSPREYTPEKLITMVQEIYNPDKKQYPVGDYNAMKMNDQMASGSKIFLEDDEEFFSEKRTIDSIINSKGHFKIGSQYALTVSPESFPKTTSLFEIQNKLFDPMGRERQNTLPCRFLATLTVALDNVKSNTNKQVSKSRWNIGSLAFIGTTAQDKNPDIKNRKAEAINIVESCENGSEKVLEGKLDYTLFAPTEEEVNRWAKLLQTRMEDLPSGGWNMKPETLPIVSLNCMNYSLPGMYSPAIKNKFQKFNILFRSNNAKIAPLFSDFKGFGEPVMSFFGRTGQMQSFSMKDSKSNFNFCLIGPSGTGKSAFLNELIISSIDCGDVVRSIDLGYSQERTCELCGGQFEDFKEDTCLNFFTYLKTEEIIDNEGNKQTVVAEEELQTIVPMIGKMAGVNVLTAADIDAERSVTDQMDLKVLKNTIEVAIQEAFTIRRHNAGMQEVYDALVRLSENLHNSGHQEIRVLVTKLYKALEDYVIVEKSDDSRIVGKYYKYFNGANNLEIKKDYFVQELQRLNKKSSEFATIVSMGILNKFLTEFYNRPKPFKWFILDEASDPLKDPLFVKYLDNFSLRLRKYDGGLGIATQALNHFTVNREAISLYESLAFKMFLEQDKNVIDKAKGDNLLHLDYFTDALMKSIKKRDDEFNEVMIMHRGSVMVSRLKLEPFAERLFRSDGKSKNEIAEVRRAYGLDEVDAAEFLSILDQDPHANKEEILKNIMMEKQSASI